MQSVTIPKQLMESEELVIIPKKDFDDFLAFRKAYPVVEPTAREKRAIKRGQKEIKEGKYRILD